MDRTIVYPGSIPLETDILSSNRNAMVALAKLSGAVFGTSGVVNGLLVVPTGPASLQVVVGPGEIYSLQNVDSTAYSSLAADTAHQVVKQGILADSLNLNCPAPGTAGQSINYVIQVTYNDVDALPVALPYYNASNPSVAWSGPNNSGTQQNSVRAGRAIVTVKAGVAATTGSQTTPAPDAGNIGLYTVTVANGQTTITSSSIVKMAAAPSLPAQGIVGNLRGSALLNLANGTTLSATQSGQLGEMDSVGGTVTLPAPSTAIRGLMYPLVAPTTGPMTVSTAGGAFYGGGAQGLPTIGLAPGMSGIFVCDGANWIVVALSNGVITTGFQRLSSGLIMQWGTVLISGTSGTFNFPVAFPTSVYTLVANDAGTGSRPISLFAISTSQFTANCATAGTTITFFSTGN